MSNVLVDTSVWIDALNGKKNWRTDRLNQLIEQNANIVICPVIVQELLQGIKEDADYDLVKDHLSGFELLEVDRLDAAYGAASIYRKGRKHGITIRKSNDCLIAFYAIFDKATVLHNDEDFNKIAQFTSLKVLREP